MTWPTGLDRQEMIARRACAVEWARRAGAITLEYFRRPDLAVERKSDASPVTQADRRAEEWLRQQIVREFPQDAIVGEEWGEIDGTSGFRWILDPIDGTKSFIFGVPLYATLIGIQYGDHCIVGVIHCPALRETVHAALGDGCMYEDASLEAQPARVSTRPLRQGLFVTSQVDSFDQRGAAGAFREIAQRAYVTRTWGDAYGYLLVATGRAEVMVDPVMHVWDAAAVVPVLQEAGGQFTDWLGRPTIRSGEGVGSNGYVHAEVIAITAPYATPRG